MKRNPRTRVVSAHKTAATRKRKSATNTAIAEQIRLQIVRGEYSPGDRLPPRAELEARFGSTPVTVQRAFDVLADTGFIESRGRNGTFVVAHPPHTSRYALVFPGRPNQWMPFWMLIAEQATRLEQSQRCRIVPFYEVDGRLDSPDYQRLLHEIQTKQLAGIILVMNPGQLSHTPIMKRREVPMAAIMIEPAEDKVPAVLIDYQSFFERALHALSESGCRSVGGLAFTWIRDSCWEVFFEGAKSRGLHTEPYWWIPTEISNPLAAQIYTNLLMRTGQNLHPDSLIIADDTLVEPALRGLENAGVRPGRGVELVAFTFFPARTNFRAPMQRLGYCVPQVLQAALDLIHQQHAGRAKPQDVSVQAVFENEAQEMMASTNYLIGGSYE